MKAVLVTIAGYIFVALAAQSSSSLPEGEGRAVIERGCNTQCHGTAVWASTKRTPSQWKAVVDEMVGMGADVSDADQAAIVGYLSKHFVLTVNVNTGTAKQIADALELTAKEAEAIVQYRETQGKFTSWQDVAKVPGLSAGSIEPKKDRMTF